MLGQISKGLVPQDWKQVYMTSAQLTLAQWIADLIDRLRAMDRYQSLLASKGGVPTGSNAAYWLGGFFAPEALITATRQIVAQTNSWNLEELELYLDINQQTSYPQRDGFVAEGFLLEGAEYLPSAEIALTDKLRSRLPLSSLRWQLRSSSAATGKETVAVPLYLNEERKAVLAIVHVEISKSISRTAWAQRSVSILLQVAAH
jgi:dynein heavy chain 1, cytosolic